MEPTPFYRLLLRLFPEREYAPNASKKWLFGIRFDISDDRDKSVYLRRFVLARTPWGSLYLHHILRSDADRCPHDHPWHSWLLILWGGYREHLYHWQNLGLFRTRSEVVVLRQPGCFRHMPATTTHRVELLPRPGGGEIPAWTLCLTTTKVQDWGFFQRGVKVPWREFLAGDREC